MSPNGATPLKRGTGALARFLRLLGGLLRGLQEQARPVSSLDAAACLPAPCRCDSRQKLPMFDAGWHHRRDRRCSIFRLWPLRLWWPAVFACRPQGYAQKLWITRRPLARKWLAGSFCGLWRRFQGLAAALLCRNRKKWPVARLNASDVTAHDQPFSYEIHGDLVHVDKRGSGPQAGT